MDTGQGLHLGEEKALKNPQGLAIIHMLLFFFSLAPLFTIQVNPPSFLAICTPLFYSAFAGYTPKYENPATKNHSDGEVCQGSCYFNLGLTFNYPTAAAEKAPQPSLEESSRREG